MFIPLRDIDNPVRHVSWPYVTHAIILVNVLVWLALNVLPEPDSLAMLVTFAFKPDGVPEAAAGLPFGAWQPPDPLAALTSTFLHRDFLHLAGNMAVLWVFADNVEDATGHLRFILFYILCGLAASYAQGFATPGYFTYGASGAVSGVIAAYALLHPNVRVWVLVLLRIPLPVRASWIIGAWIAFQFYNVAVDDASGVGWYAHLGGLAAGALLLPLMKRRGVALFDKGPDAARNAPKTAGEP